ncbi:hypothetical protein [Nocardia spumae]|uniref:hypothetical protein n=1 Tax=Nocardia spumae TaxID=2887190 RepID=UPI001D14FFD9|nr:hypothetical protein [Nocardia spumae]
MSGELERYELVYNPSTQQPVGVTDMWQPGARSVQDLAPQHGPYPVQGPVYRPIPTQMPVYSYPTARLGLPVGTRSRLYVYGILAVFAAGLAAGCWLFGPRESDGATTVIVCPAPGVQVAALPAECGPPAGGESR